jgi:hypothetical protein
LASTLLFALSLLTKASGLFALPTAAALFWVQRRGGVTGCGDARWLAVWLGIALLYAVPQIAAFAPVSQLFPFVNPVADRYLYFILPGLIGGALLWAQACLAPSQRPWIRSGRAPAVLLAALVACFAWQSAERTPLWRSETRLLVDAARRGYATQPQLRVLGLAHLEREEHAEAVAALEASLRVGGRLDAVVRAELAEARARLAATGGTRHSRPTP